MAHFMDAQPSAIFETHPVVAALARSAQGDIPELPETVAIVFLLSGSILTLPETVERLRSAGRLVYVHVDLMEGLGRDRAAMEYLKKAIRPTGILSTHSSLVRYARELGLSTIQRIFAIDSLSFEKGVRMVEATKPDFVEILPGIAPGAITRLHQQVPMPIIAGGLIATKQDVLQALAAGAIAISTSQPELWAL